MPEPWYRNSYRRCLVDMHISDLNESYLSRFDPEDYLKMMMTARIDTAEIYLQSHVGLCYFPTESGVMHKAFRNRPDAVRRLVNLCRANGMRVVGYYSLIFNTVEEDRHPSWGILDDPAGGTTSRVRGSRYGHLCPNNAEYRAFLERQIAEIAAYFTLDGIFYDMTYWPAVCYCPACRERFARETGVAELPDLSLPDAPHAALFREKRYEWIGEFARWVKETTNRLMPGVTVTQNAAHAVSGNWVQASGEQVERETDYCGGDLYGDSYKHTFCIKYYYHATPHQPFEYMNARFPVDLKQHTLCKSAEDLSRGVLLSTAYHGATMMIDAMDPVGTLDPRVYRRMGEAFRLEKRYEPYLKTGEAVEDLAVWYVSRGRYNSTGQNFDSLTCSNALSTTLVRAHLPHGILSDTAMLPHYPLVCLPAAAGLTENDREALLAYVKAGGRLYFSGAEDRELLKAFFGGEVKGYTTDCRCTYLAPTAEGRKAFAEFDERYPLPVAWQQPLLDGVGAHAAVLAKVCTPDLYSKESRGFASIHSDPPGVVTPYPAVLETDYGKGRVIWSAAPIEESGSPAHRRVILALLDRLLPARRLTVRTTAPAQVELVTFADRETLLISAIDHLCTEERIPVAPFEICVRSETEPTEVRKLPDGKPLAFRYEDGVIRFCTEELVLFDMYEIKLQS